MPLAEYMRKRRFDKTPKPAGRLKHPKSKRQTFVVQRHQASQLHYDLRLELDDVLKSWAVPKGPTLTAGKPRLAMMVEDHPLDYANFEGQIPEGNYGAGEVIIWDHGWYEPRIKHAEKDQQKLLREELKAGHLTIILHGQRLKGEFALVKSPKMGDKAWLLIKKNDEYATGRRATKTARVKA